MDRNFENEAKKGRKLKTQGKGKKFENQLTKGRKLKPVEERK